MKLVFILLALGALAMLALTLMSRMMGGGAGGRKTLGQKTLESPKTLVAVPASIADQIAKHIANGQKIEAVKLLREKTGCSLTEAKDTIDVMAR